MPMLELEISEHVSDNIMSLIGNTPLLRLRRIFKNLHFNLYAKMEMFNPGGSIKDRTAMSIIKHGLETGEIKPGGIVVESSSGNMGIGLAQACLIHNLRFICVIDPKTTQQNVQILKAYGAEVDCVTEPDSHTGEFLQARINRVQDYLQNVPGSFWPNQYANPYNPMAHYRTMQEISDATGGELDYLFCATSTCGTIRGCAEYVRDNFMSTKIVAIDAVGSVIFGSERAKRLIPGHGAGIVPPLFHDSLASSAVHVTDLDCVIGCRRLVRREAILAGGSSGAVIMGIEKVKHLIPSGATCVAILPDRGERYLDTVYSEPWVETHFGSVDLESYNN
jgi:cysteine synthase A